MQKISQVGAQLERLYAILLKAVENKQPCPSSTELAEALGIQSNEGVHHLFKRLETAGRIIVRREKYQRIVYISSLGKSTVPAQDRGTKGRYEFRNVDPVALPRDTPPLSATLEELKAVKNDRACLEDFEEVLERVARELGRPARHLFRNWSKTPMREEGRQC